MSRTARLVPRTILTLITPTNSTIPAYTPNQPPFIYLSIYLENDRVVKHSLPWSYFFSCLTYLDHYFSSCCYRRPVLGLCVFRGVSCLPHCTSLKNYSYNGLMMVVTGKTVVNLSWETAGARIFSWSKISMHCLCDEENARKRYLIKSWRSSAEESGFGLVQLWGMLASYLVLTAIFPPIALKLFTSSSVHSSSFTDTTFDICTPRLLCTPEHLIQMKAPVLKDLIQFSKSLNLDLKAMQ